MNTTASSTSTGYSFTNAVNQATIYTFPLTTLLILITNIMNGCVLVRRALRSSSCTHYFLASVAGTIIYLTSTPFNLWLISTIGMNPYNSPFGCRISPFIAFASPLFVTLMLVCSSIDRFCSSSSSARLRKFSQVRIARQVIIIVSIFTIIFISPIWYIYQWDPNVYTCRQISTTSITIYLSSRVVVYYIVAPLTLAIFGVLTIYNIRSRKHRVTPINQLNVHRRAEGQLARMLIIHVSVYLIFSTPSGIAYVLYYFVPSLTSPLITSLRIVSIIWQQGSFFLSILIYILSGTIYREELKKMFKLNQNRVQILPNSIQRSTARFQPTAVVDTGVKIN